MRKSLVVTGASGFVGRALVETAVAAGWNVRPLRRQEFAGFADAAQGGQSAKGNARDAGAWDRLFASDDGVPPVVVHLAARAHVLQDRAADPLVLFRRANVDFAVAVARVAFARGVRRFVFVSSIGAVGERSVPGHPLSEGSPCMPRSDYGISKLEAEAALGAIAAEYGAELVIVRPPLVYGHGAPGNLARMARWVGRGIPLPLKGVRNQRSLIHVHNLCSALLCCAVNEQAAGRIYHVRDPQDYSTPGILQLAAQTLGVRARLFAMPAGLLRCAARLAGMSRAYDQLCGTLQVDDARIRRELEFAPSSYPFEL